MLTISSCLPLHQDKGGPKARFERSPLAQKTFDLVHALFQAVFLRSNQIWVRLSPTRDLQKALATGVGARDFHSPNLRYSIAIHIAPRSRHWRRGSNPRRVRTLPPYSSPCVWKQLGRRRLCPGWIRANPTEASTRYMPNAAGGCWRDCTGRGPRRQGGRTRLESLRHLVAWGLESVMVS